MSAVALGFLTAPMLMLTGCGDYVGDTTYSTDNSDNSGQDHSIDYGSGTVLVCNDANCSVLGTPAADRKINDGNFTYQEVSDSVGVYPGPQADPAECNAAGYFWCSIEKQCLNQPLNDSSSSCNK